MLARKVGEKRLRNENASNSPVLCDQEPHPSTPRSRVCECSNIRGKSGGTARRSRRRIIGSFSSMYQISNPMLGSSIIATLIDLDPLTSQAIHRHPQCRTRHLCATDMRDRIWPQGAMRSVPRASSPREGHPMAPGCVTTSSGPPLTETRPVSQGVRRINTEHTCLRPASSTSRGDAFSLIPPAVPKCQALHPTLISRSSLKQWGKLPRPFLRPLPQVRDEWSRSSLARLLGESTNNRGRRTLPF